MKKVFLIFLFLSPLLASIGGITIEVDEKNAKIFIEGKFQYSLEKKMEPPQLIMTIPDEPFPYEKRRVFTEKGIRVIADRGNGGTRIVISPGVDFSYEDYWGAGYLVILLTLKEKPTTIKRVPRGAPRRAPEREKKGGKLFLYLNDAPKPLVYKALSKLTGQTFPGDTGTTRITLRIENATLSEILKELRRK
jgi:hypothetical protein